MTVYNLQVSSGPDDGYVVHSNQSINSTALTIQLAATGIASIWARFTDVPDLRSHTIDAASLRLHLISRTGTALFETTLHADTDSAPAAPTTYADYVDKSKTSATTSWDDTFLTPGEWYDSPSIVNVLNEISSGSGLPVSVVQLLWDGGSNTPTNNIAFRSYNGSSSLAPILYLELTPFNTAPEITTPPSVSYGSLTRLGPNNTPATVTAEAEDPEETGVGELTAEIRTAASGAGTLVATQNVTSGVPFQMNVAHNASGLTEGTNQLHMRVGDGTAWSDDAPFTVLVDRTPPSVGTITHSPNPVMGGG